MHVVPLSTLFSQVLVAHTVEFDDLAEQRIFHGTTVGGLTGMRAGRQESRRMGVSSSWATARSTQRPEPKRQRPVRFSVDTAIAALDGDQWALLVAEDRPRSMAGTGADAVIWARRQDPGTVKTERLSGDGGLGTTYRNVSKFAGRKTELTYTVDELRDGEMISIRGENNTVKSRDTMEFNRTSGGTEIVYTVVFAFQGAVRFFEPLLRPFVKRLGDNGERGIRDYLNGLTPKS